MTEKLFTYFGTQTWFMNHRNDPNYKIILCGQDDDWPNPPEDVRVHTWVGAKGMVKAREVRKQERLYISKYCKDLTQNQIESGNLFEEEEL